MEGKIKLSEEYVFLSLNFFLIEMTYVEEFNIYGIFLCNSAAFNLGFGDSFVGVTYFIVIF